MDLSDWTSEFSSEFSFPEILVTAPVKAIRVPDHLFSFFSDRTVASGWINRRHLVGWLVSLVSRFEPSVDDGTHTHR